MQDTKHNRSMDAMEERAQSGKRHKHKRRGALRRLYAMVLFLMLTIGVVLIFTVFFKVKTIEVLGVTRYATEDVIASSGIVPEVNMFRLNRTGICNNLVREYSYLKDVSLKYTLPDTVTIVVTEAEPVGAVKQGGSYFLFSAENRVLEIGVAAPPKNVPVVKGLGESLSVAAGGQLDIVDADGLAELNEKIEDLEKKIANSKSSEKVLAQKRAELDELTAQADVMIAEQDARRARITVLNAFFAAQRAESLAGITVVDVTDPYNLVVNRGSGVEILLGSEADIASKVELASRVLHDELETTFEGRVDASFPGKAYVMPMDFSSQNMSADEYAKLLFETSSQEETTSSTADAASTAAPAAPSASAPAQAQASAAPQEVDRLQEVAGTELEQGEEPEGTPSAPAIPPEEDFIAAEEE